MRSLRNLRNAFTLKMSACSWDKFINLNLSQCKMEGGVCGAMAGRADEQGGSPRVGPGARLSRPGSSRQGGDARAARGSAHPASVRSKPTRAGARAACRAGVSAAVFACLPFLCGSVRFKVPNTVCGRCGRRSRESAAGAQATLRLERWPRAD